MGLGVWCPSLHKHPGLTQHQAECFQPFPSSCSTLTPNRVAQAISMLHARSASGLPFLSKELKVTLLEGDVLVDFTSPAPLVPAFCFISPESAGEKKKKLTV